MLDKKTFTIGVLTLTAAMLPAFLRFLKAGGYRIVHVVAPVP